jgi:protein-S-isoprenylcysteine O-methyltransferase Ste14
MAASKISAAFSMVVYLYFFVGFHLFLAFLLPADVVPESLHGIVRTLDTAPEADSAWDAIVCNLLLILAFTLPHTILATDTVKTFHGIPESYERPMYVLQTTAALHALTIFWRGFLGGFHLWDLRGTASETYVLYLWTIGYLFLLSATFALDHFHLFGLTQGFGIDFNKAIGLSTNSHPMKEDVSTGKCPISSARTTNKIGKTGHGLVVRWHYSLVAHPIMTGMLTCFWATPVMTAPRLLFAVGLTTYILAEVKLMEEPRLKSKMGKAYDQYLKSVPSFCPYYAPPAKTAAKNTCI